MIKNEKAIFYIIGFITIVFILPVIFTASPKSQETIAQEENQKQDTEEKNIKTENMNPYYLKYQKIFKDYISIFSDARKHLWLFWGVPGAFIHCTGAGYCAHK